METTKQLDLRKRLIAIGRVAIAFSAGADSAFLLRESLRAGAKTLALTADTPFLTRREYDRAKRIALDLGAPHEFIKIDALSNALIIENSANRCYYCKDVIMRTLVAHAKAKGYTLCDGANADDQNMDRPGARAARENGVISPLEEAGFTKNEIRALSDGLITRNLPSNACLATRVPCGTPITKDTLMKVERAEDALTALGFIGIRVRAHGNVARLEWPGELSEITQCSKAASAACLSAGFEFACIDLNGYRVGGANA